MDTFEPIFLQDMSPMLEHDLFLLVHPPQSSPSSLSSQSSSQSTSQSSSQSSKGKKLTREMRRLLNSWETTNTLQHISDLLVKGMTNRISKIRVVFFNPNPNPNPNPNMGTGRGGDGASDGSCTQPLAARLRPHDRARAG